MKTNQQLKELHLPFFNWRDLFHFTPSSDMPFLPQKDADALDSYFQHFVPPGPCIKCGAQQGTGGLLDRVFARSRFRYGLKHGEGQCTTGGCGWPARALHYNIGPVKELEMILQYHPDVVTWDV
jgi:hypothetical protein